MTGRLLVLGGTGTGIGKTHLGEALLAAASAAGHRAVGLKPIESGVSEGTVSDVSRLAAKSSFHVKQFGYALRAPISPHLAARHEGVVLELEPLLEEIRAVGKAADALLVELPGGLFTPLADGVVNADFAARLAPDALVLVAPDRLGTLHDTLATLRAAAAMSLRVDGVVLVTPAEPDPSTSTNAAELARFTAVRVLSTLPRGSAVALATHPSVRAVLSAWLP